MNKRPLPFINGDIDASGQEGREAKRRLGNAFDPLELGSADGIAHGNSPSSLRGSATIADAGEGETLSGGSAGQRCSHFTDATPVPGIDPVDGWALCSYPYLDGDGFESDLYVARAADGDVRLDVSRFRFTPTQERFAWLVGAGFPSRPGITPWDDEDIDRAAARRECVA